MPPAWRSSATKNCCAGPSTTCSPTCAPTPRRAPSASITAASPAADDAAVTIEVSDDGPGVPADQLGHIFDRFYRAGAQSYRPGSGLGLAIVTAVATTHQGTADAALNDPHGLRITLTLPACGRAGPAAPAGPAGAAAANAQGASARPA